MRLPTYLDIKYESLSDLKKYLIIAVAAGVKFKIRTHKKINK